MQMRYLLQRGDFFYFHRRIPPELQPQFGSKRELRLSLGTRDRKAAKKLVKRYDLELEKLCVAAKLQLPDEVIKTAIAGSVLLSPRKTGVAEFDFKFSGYSKQFLLEKQTTLRADGIETFRGVFKEFTDIIKDRNIQTYSHGDLIEFRDTIGATGIKPTTVNKKVRYLSVFFNWLVMHGFVKQNPCRGLTIRKTAPDHELKGIFAQDDIDRWFSSPAFVIETCLDYPPQFFWIPLLGLLGFRINEICQLQTGDIREVEGVWCVDVNSREGKQIKSLSSARLVPFPKFILDIGFLDYWRRRRDLGEDQRSGHPRGGHPRGGHPQGGAPLFPVKFLKGNRPDYNYQVRWYIRKFVTTDKKKSFHSFRGTLATRLKTLGARETVPEALISQILGHANSSLTMGRYGKPYSPGVLLEALEKIDYKLDVERLKEVARVLSTFFFKRLKSGD